MFKQLSLSMKLAVGFSAVLLILVVLGGIVYLNLGNISERSHAYVDYSRLNSTMAEKEGDHLEWVRNVEHLFLENLESTGVEMDPHKCALGKFLSGEECQAMMEADPAFKKLVHAIEEPHRRLHESARHLEDVWRTRHEGLTDILRDRLRDHHEWALKVSKMIIENDPSIDVELDADRCALGQWLRTEQYRRYAEDFPELRQIVADFKQPHQELHESAGLIQQALREGDRTGARDIFENRTLVALGKVAGGIQQAIDAEGQRLQAQDKAKQLYERETLTALADTRNFLKEIASHAHQQAADQADLLQGKVKTSLSMIIFLTAGAVLAGGLISFFLARSITRAIKRVIESLTSGSEQVTSASGQVAQSSQQMAEGASEQASSLEEISASLEEMASMTKQTAENANQANSMGTQTRKSSESGSTAMQRLNEVINKIKESSDETGNIVKTIDEIAFQTNLLALNAAVEAARAGEAGKGFAVVAEEVRSLAMRSAEAAKNTAKLIEEAKENADNGVNVSAEVDQALKQITENAQAVDNLINEVSSASEEQSKGIDQVNTAMADLDKVTQSNAANAEESASASEELSGQAQELNGMVETLAAIVGGARAKLDRHHAQAVGSSRRYRSSQSSFNTVAKKDQKADTTKVSARQERKANAQEATIPLDDDDLADF